jgi:hypothetical protein
MNTSFIIEAKGVFVRIGGWLFVDLYRKERSFIYFLLLLHQLQRILQVISRVSFILDAVIRKIIEFRQDDRLSPGLFPIFQRKKMLQFIAQWVMSLARLFSRRNKLLSFIS